MEQTPEQVLEISKEDLKAEYIENVNKQVENKLIELDQPLNLATNQKLKDFIEHLSLVIYTARCEQHMGVEEDCDLHITLRKIEGFGDAANTWCPTIDIGSYPRLPDNVALKLAEKLYRDVLTGLRGTPGSALKSLGVSTVYRDGDEIVMTVNGGKDYDLGLNEHLQTERSVVDLGLFRSIRKDKDAKESDHVPKLNPEEEDADDNNKLDRD
ncbi:hypothetical protein F5Y19DRAFT_476687 [Xylariaceae sp. FL1651]|nr:hypothetical protein F5Y19DRAFT_476687 [Xylariaceae sp. FL1651]